MQSTGTRPRQSGFTLIELLIVVAIIGLIAAIAIPNLRNAMNKPKQGRTLADMRTIGSALETYSIDNNVYPRGLSDVNAAALSSYLSRYLKSAPANDAWHNPLHVDPNPPGTVP